MVWNDLGRIWEGFGKVTPEEDLFFRVHRIISARFPNIGKTCSGLVKPSVVKPISGVWYGCYKANGTAISDNNDGKTLDYAHAYDVYEFNEDGTGSFHRHFIGEHANTPEIVFISVRRFWWFP